MVFGRVPGLKPWRRGGQFRGVETPRFHLAERLRLPTRSHPRDKDKDAALKTAALHVNLKERLVFGGSVRAYGPQCFQVNAARDELLAAPSSVRSNLRAVEECWSPANVSVNAAHTAWRVGFGLLDFTSGGIPLLQAS
jgi:hypothetical protein